MRFWPLPGQPTEKKERRAWRWRAWGNIGKATVWASLVVYLIYLVFSWNEPTASFSMIPGFPSSPFLRRLLMPIWKYLSGLIGFAFGAASRPTYILGHAYSHGVWFYFPVLTLLKSPLAFLLLLALAIAIALLIKSRRGKEFSAIPMGMELHWRCVWVSLVIFTAACMLNRLDISIRHFSIALALIIVLLAPLPRMLEFLHNDAWHGDSSCSMDHGRAGRHQCIDRDPRLSKLFSVHQYARHGPPSVSFGQRFEPRLESRSAASRKICNPARITTSPIGRVWPFRTVCVCSAGATLEMPAAVAV
jgi:hypothetical protein